MKYIAIILLGLLGFTNQAGPGLYVCKSAKVSLYSEAPIEDISAESNTGASVFNPATGELVFSITIRSLVFPKSLMQEHFNTDYMESDKFPKATFKGKIQQTVDVTKNGTYPVTASGELEVHGVKQTRSIPGSITVNNGAVSITSEFYVKCADHNITIPKLVFHNIAESVRIRIAAEYTEYKK